MKDLKTVLLLLIPVLLVAGGIFVANGLSEKSEAPGETPDGVRKPLHDGPVSHDRWPKVPGPRGPMIRPGARVPPEESDDVVLRPETLKELLADGSPASWFRIKELIQRRVEDPLEVVDLLVTAMKGGGMSATWAAQLIPFIQDEEARRKAGEDLLTLALEVEDPHVMKAAVLVVGQVAGGDAVEGLMDLARSVITFAPVDTHEGALATEKAVATVMAIASIASPESYRALNQLFGESIGTERQGDLEKAIMRAAASPESGPGLVAELAANLEEGTPRELELATVRTLGLTRSPAALDPLKKFYATETDPSAREAALLAVSHIGDEAAVTELIRIRKEGGEDSRAAGLALANVEGKDAVGPLVAALDDETDPMVRSAIVKGLGNTESPAAAERLREILQSGHENQSLRGAAAQGLAKIGDLEAVGPMLDALESAGDGDRNLKIHVVNSLGEMARFGSAHDPLVARALPVLTKLRDNSSEQDSLYYYTLKAIQMIEISGPRRPK